MEHNRKIKILSIVALVLAISAMTLGFAAFSTTLNISSSASVTPNSGDFSVKFSTSQNSLVVAAVAPSSKSTGASATNGTINNEAIPTLTNLSATFSKPGDYVEYTVYARNEGQYTAYLNNINFLGSKSCTASAGTTESLVQSACESINVKATIGETTYTETTPISNHTLASNTGESLKVRLEYDENGTAADGSFSITFPNIALVYSTVNDSLIQPTLPKVTSIVSGDINTIGSEVAIGDEHFYVYKDAGDDVLLLAKYNLYVGNKSDDDNGVVKLSNPTGIQSSKAIGYFYGYSTEDPIIGVTPFSSDEQKGTNYSDYSGSIVEGYVNTYKTYIEGQGVVVKEARLPLHSELTVAPYNCEEWGSCNTDKTFIYSTSYWSGSVIDTLNVWRVRSDGDFSNSIYFYDDGFGVRPVIKVSKSEF